MIYRPGQAMVLVSQANQVAMGEEAVDYCNEADTLFAAMATQPNATRKEVINTCIESLISAGVWSKIDSLWVLAAHDAQAGLLDWKRLCDATNVGSTPFATDRGFQRNTGTKYIDTNFNFTSTGSHYTQNDASFGVYSRTDSQSASYDFGGYDYVNHQQRIRTTADAWQFHVNCTTSTGKSGITSSLGFFCAQRNSATAMQLYLNGSNVHSITPYASAAPESYTAYIGTRNLNTGPSTYTNRQYAAAYMGAALSDAEHAAFYSALQTYMTAIGANV